MDVTYTPDNGRDYLGEIYAELDRAVPEGGYIAAVVARDVIKKLKTSDPELVSGFGWMRAELDAADYLARRSNSTRQTARIMAPRTAFADAIEEFENTGETKILRDFLTAEYVVNDENLRLKLADMTGSDHRYVASRYGDTAKRAASLEAFHQAVAKHVGDRRTGDVYTSEQLVMMYRSLVGEDPM
jgi:hypothetical protein